MYELSKTSRDRLLSCDKRLIELFYEILKYRDFTVIEGHRGKEKQEKYFSEGKSQLHYPNSKHNSSPSSAVDVLPYINGRMVNGDQKGDVLDICYFSGFVMGIARKMRMNIKWGGDWNENFTLKDNWHDLPHYEIK